MTTRHTTLTMPLLLVLGTLAAPEAQAQQAGGLQASAGFRMWNTEWTSFTYDAAEQIKQVQYKSKLVVLPVVRLSYGDFIAVASSMQTTRFESVSGGRDPRSEYDLSLGYQVMPGVQVQLGYKRVKQEGIQDGKVVFYKPGGLLLGANLAAPIQGPLSVYANFGMSVGGFRSPKPIEYDNRYRVAELGLAYNLPMDAFVRTLTFTAGYRTQVLDTLNAQQAGQPRQDARDLTHGLAAGVMASF